VREATVVNEQISDGVAGGMTEGINRAAFVLGLGAAACSLFVFVDPIQYRLVRLHGLGVAVLLVLAVVAMAGARLGRRPLVAGSGAGFLLAAAVQLVQLGDGPNWLRGDGSTLSLFLGFGVGLLALGLISVPDAAPEPVESTGEE
jgi:hypothetical protein